MVHRPVPVLGAVITHAVLLRQEGAAPRCITLGPVPIWIGRNPQNELVLAAPEVSRQHCRIGLSDGVRFAERPELDQRRLYRRAARSGPTRLAPWRGVALGPFTLTYLRGTADELAEAEARERKRGRSAISRRCCPRRCSTGRFSRNGASCRRRNLAATRSAIAGWTTGGSPRSCWMCRGHGVGAALLAASAANMLRRRGIGADPSDPVAVLQALNAAFQMDDHDGLFFSLWYGVYHAPDPRATLRLGRSSSGLSGGRGLASSAGDTGAGDRHGSGPAIPG